MTDGPVLSFWERDALLDADVLVVGAGIVGTLTAIECAERAPSMRVRVLERGVLPYGATSRNAGFACFGSLTELIADRARMGDDALDLVERRWKGLARLRARLGDDAIGYEHLGGSELLFEESLGALDALGDVNRWLRPLFGRDVFSEDRAGLAAAGFGGARALVANPLEGQVHSGRLVRALHRMAGERGVEVLTGAEVSSVRDEGDRVEVGVRGAQGFEIPMRASQVVVCANGLIPALVPSSGVTPGRGQVLVTEAVAGLPWRGCYHFDEGYWYFRNVGDRVLLGGGRNVDFAGEETPAIALSDAIQRAQDEVLARVLLPGRAPRVEHRWAGIMGFTADKRPVVRRASPRVLVGFGCNGMGVALGAEVAARAALLVAGVGGDDG